MTKTDNDDAGMTAALVRTVLILLLVIPGCHVFDRTPDWNEYNYVTSLECHETLNELPPCCPPVDHIRIAKPSALSPLTPSNYMDAEPAPMHLADAISGSLTQSEIVRTIIGPDQAGTAATGFDPVIQEAIARQSLAAFDPQLSLSQNWSTDNQPGAPEFDRANTRLSLDRSFISGANVNLGFTSDYAFAPALPLPASYRSRLELGVTQPLLRGAGPTINRVPLVIARASAGSSLWDFRSALQSQIRSIETAYRNLYAAQESVRVLEEVVALAKDVVRVQKHRVALKASVEADQAQAESQLASLEQSLIQAISSMLGSETLLRNLLGWPATDGRRIVAVDRPFTAPFSVDWDSALVTAINHRPDIAQQRLSVLIREQLLVQARNNLMPQADLIGLLRTHGEHNTLDSSVDTALGGGFGDGAIGFSVNLPLRNHGAGGAAQAAELQLLRARALFRQTVHTASHELTNVVRDIQATQEQYAAAAKRLEAAEVFLTGAKARYANPRAGSQLLLLLSVYLGALNDYATATTSANNVLAQYNVALVRFEEAQGTLLQANNVYIGEDVASVLPTGLYDQFVRRFSASDLNDAFPGVGTVNVHQVGPVEVKAE
ncbi:MAG: TolC family protein [Planctomycetaceae bacterium]|nr:TolC family protein [Planctomycetaceae bacterium]